jgi:hypothetical protein
MRTCSFIAVACGLAVASSAKADIFNLFANLDGLQEVPAVVTTGSGFASMTLDNVTNQFTLTGSFANLTGTTNNGHVHGPAPVGVSAGVLFGITFDFGVTSGNFSFNGVITPAQTATILAGNSYINIHSTFRPGGEIRGQIVPAPSMLAMLSLGGAALIRRRR